MESELHEFDPNNPELGYLSAVVMEFQNVAARFYDTIELMRAALNLPPLAPPQEPEASRSDIDAIPF